MKFNKKTIIKNEILIIILFILISFKVLGYDYNFIIDTNNNFSQKQINNVNSINENDFITDTNNNYFSYIKNGTSMLLRSFTIKDNIINWTHAQGITDNRFSYMAFSFNQSFIIYQNSIINYTIMNYNTASNDLIIYFLDESKNINFVISSNCGISGIEGDLCFNFSSMGFSNSFQKERINFNLYSANNSQIITKINKYIVYSYVTASTGEKHNLLTNITLFNILNGTNELPIINSINYNSLILEKSITDYTTFDFILNVTDLENDTIYYSLYLDNSTKFVERNFREDFQKECNIDYSALNRKEFLTNLSFPLDAFSNYFDLFIPNELFLADLGECYFGVLFTSYSQGKDFIINFDKNNYVTQGQLNFIEESTKESNFNVSFRNANGEEFFNLNFDLNSTHSTIFNGSGEPIYSSIYSSIPQIDRRIIFFNYEVNIPNQTIYFTFDDFNIDTKANFSINTNNFKQFNIKRNGENFILNYVNVLNKLQIPELNWQTSINNYINISNNFNVYDFYIYVTDIIHKDIPEYNYEKLHLVLLDSEFYNNQSNFNFNNEELEAGANPFKSLIYLLQFPRRLSKDLGIYDAMSNSLFYLLIFGMIVYFFNEIKNTGSINLEGTLGAGAGISLFLFMIGMFNVIQLLAYLIPFLIFLAIHIKNSTEAKV